MRSNQTDQFNIQVIKALNYLGVAIGLAGLVTIAPALGEVGSIFGLGFIVWFVWAGIAMLSNSSSSTQ